jgi:serine/threonine protein kinase
VIYDAGVTASGAGARQRLPPGAIVLGRYRIEGPLGAGTMGAVYRASGLPGGRAAGLEVALKHLPGDPRTADDPRRRLEREARALAAAAHPNVVSVIELDHDDAGLYLVTELVTGGTLEKLLAQRRLELRSALALADQVLAGLGHAHALGILHRDVKPANVLLDHDGRAKLVDFGLAKFHDQGTWGEQSTLTSQGAILGTPAYMAPEQVFGPTVDARSDVYSAGVLAFELLTGSWPFVAEDTVDILRAHATETPPRLGATRGDVDFSPELEQWIARALAKSPSDRWSDARTMRIAMPRMR